MITTGHLLMNKDDDSYMRKLKNCWHLGVRAIVPLQHFHNSALINSCSKPDQHKMPPGKRRKLIDVKWVDENIVSQISEEFLKKVKSLQESVD